MRVRDLERRVGPAERGLGAGQLLGAERLAVRLRRAGLLGRAEADGRLAGDQGRAVDFFARAMARLIACGSWPSMRAARQPAASKRFTWSTESESDSGPSMEMPLSSKSTIRRFEPQVAGKRDRLMAEALHEVAVGGEHVGAMVDERRRRTRR